MIRRVEDRLYGWLARRNLRRALAETGRPREGRYDCPHCGGFLETGMPDPHSAKVHLREFCLALKPDEAAREIVALVRRHERVAGRRMS